MLRDTIIVGTWQQPRSFWDIVNSQSIRVEMELLYRPRWVMPPQLRVQPNPALVDGDLPSLENGGAVLEDVAVKAGRADLQPADVSGGAGRARHARQAARGHRPRSSPALKWDGWRAAHRAGLRVRVEVATVDPTLALDVTYCPYEATPGAGGIARSVRGAR